MVWTILIATVAEEHANLDSAVAGPTSVAGPTGKRVAGPVTRPDRGRKANEWRHESKDDDDAGEWEKTGRWGFWGRNGRNL